MSYCAKLAGEDVSHHLNKTESVGLRKAQCYRQISDLTVSAYISLPYIRSFQRRSSQPISWLSTEELNKTQRKQTCIHNKIYDNIK